MTDEQAFLDALAANPADDTTRLVYADWLDDRGEAAKAEYLRLVVGLVPHYATADSDPPAVARVHALTELSPREWRQAVATRFGCALDGYSPGHKVTAVRWVQALTGFGLAEALRVVESAPSRIPARLTFEDAVGIRTRLHAGSSVRIEIRPCDPNDPPKVVVFRVSAELVPLDWANFDEAIWPGGAIEGFREFLTAALGVSAERAAELAATGSAALAEDIEPARLAVRLPQWKALIPNPYAVTDRGWAIMLHSTYQVRPPVRTP
jgi:uncharacterized protein (TIGR02996 family)